jgi:hypothetical protein
MPVALDIWRVSHVRVQHARWVELEGACLTCAALSSYETLGRHSDGGLAGTCAVTKLVADRRSRQPDAGLAAAAMSLCSG